MLKTAIVISSLALSAALVLNINFEPVATIKGIASIKDGDGILFGKVEVRLQGIAAPEDNSKKREPGGPEATANLRALVEGKSVTCELDGTLARKRPVGVCYLDGNDIGEHQVRMGHARDCPAFSHGRYYSAELEARRAGRDLSRIYPLPDYC